MSRIIQLRSRVLLTTDRTARNATSNSSPAGKSSCKLILSGPIRILCPFWAIPCCVRWSRCQEPGLHALRVVLAGQLNVGWAACFGVLGAGRAVTLICVWLSRLTLAAVGHSRSGENYSLIVTAYQHWEWQIIWRILPPRGWARLARFYNGGTWLGDSIGIDRKKYGNGKLLAYFLHVSSLQRRR